MTGEELSPAVVDVDAEALERLGTASYRRDVRLLPLRRLRRVDDCWETGLFDWSPWLEQGLLPLWNHVAVDFVVLMDLCSFPNPLCAMDYRCRSTTVTWLPLL